MQQENLTLEVVEPFGVFAEDHGVVLIVDIFPVENFIDLVQCVVHRDFESRGLEKEDANLFLTNLL